MYSLVLGTDILGRILGRTQVLGSERKLSSIPLRHFDITVCRHELLVDNQTSIHVYTSSWCAG